MANPDEELDESLELTPRNHVRRLPVLDQEGRLAGVVVQEDDEPTGGQTRWSRKPRSKS
jgi:CBS-domain-containing membrane protein